MFDTPGAKRIQAYYADLITRLGRAPENVRSIVIAHTLDDSEAFLWAIDAIAPISLLLPKPKSAASESGQRVLESLTYPRPTEPLDRDTFDIGYVASLIETHVPADAEIVISDIGGYFAPILEELFDLLGPRLLGVLEGTENGAIAWEEAYEKSNTRPSVPIVTVARSPLKLPEDYLVGMGIVFSIEAALREQVQVLQTRTACVIGFGRVGRGIADSLRTRGVATAVYDISPIARAEAAVRGFPVFEQIEDAIKFASLVVSATGHKTINHSTLSAMQDGTVVASVTSRDSEVEGDETLQNYWTWEQIDKSEMWRYRRINSDKSLWMVSNGNAPNFRHGAVLGPALHLISGEKIAALHAIADRTLPREKQSAAHPLVELDVSSRERVAITWNDHFIANR